MAPVTRTTARTMTEESALAHVNHIFGTIEGENVRLALENGGVEKVSDLKELTFEDLGLLEYTQSATASKEAVAKHLNILQQRKLMLIPLWYEEQEVHELSTWFDLTPELYDTWRGARRGLSQHNRL
jgi:hypothetical protein